MQTVYKIHTQEQEMYLVEGDKKYNGWKHKAAQFMENILVWMPFLIINGISISYVKIDKDFVRPILKEYSLILPGILSSVIRKVFDVYLRKDKTLRLEYREKKLQAKGFLFLFLYFKLYLLKKNSILYIFQLHLIPK